MSIRKKYARSLHAQISLGTTSDDRFMPDGYVQAFAEMDALVLTEKLDGQNNCLSKKGVFARSHAAPSILPWDRPLRERWQLIKQDLKELEIFGENMYGIHSIAYKKLESYFYVFAIRDGEQWLSWEEVKFYAALLDFPTVPEINLSISLKDFYANYMAQSASKHPKTLNENKLLADWLQANLSCTWEAAVETGGWLGGYDPISNKPCCEGFVVRNRAAFKTNDGVLPVADNEFNNLFKLVRKAHVKTDVHWTKNWQAARLADYEKYKWMAYAYQ